MLNGRDFLRIKGIQVGNPNIPIATNRKIVVERLLSKKVFRGFA
jgi:hypothetical protein